MPLNELERLRGRLAITAVALGVGTVFAILFSVGLTTSRANDPFGMMDMNMGAFFGPFIIVVIIVFAAVLIYNSMYKDYRAKYKEVICRTVLEQMFDVEEFSPDKGFSEDFVENTFLVQRGNRFSSDDYVRGKYNGYSFERSDILVQEEVSDGENGSTTYTYFHGNWTIFEFPKSFSKYLMMKERELFFTSGPSGGLFSGKPKTHKVKFESIEFNEIFAVFAEDEHEAFYLLSPVFMERFMELKKRTEGKMTVGFIDNKLHILFDTGTNQMEPRLFTPVSEEDMRSIEVQMSIIGEIVDLFRLNENR